MDSNTENTDNTEMLTREQQYAVDVFARVEAFGKLHPKGSTACDKYGAMAHKLPVLVRTAGLAQALAFVDARGDESHKQLLADLAGTVGYADAHTFVAQSRTLAFPQYMRLGQKVMAALLWYKRFAQSVLKVEANDDGEVIS